MKKAKRYYAILSKALPTRIDAREFRHIMITENHIAPDRLRILLVDGKYRVIRKIYEHEVTDSNPRRLFHRFRSLERQTARATVWLKRRRCTPRKRRRHVKKSSTSTK
jgi:hypothetical protein